jgi:hypothetical protein
VKVLLESDEFEDKGYVRITLIWMSEKFIIIPGGGGNWNQFPELPYASLEVQ